MCPKHRIINKTLKFLVKYSIFSHSGEPRGSTSYFFEIKIEGKFESPRITAKNRTYYNFLISIIINLLSRRRIFNSNARIRNLLKFHVIIRIY